MTQDEINKMFENRWRIYGTDDAIEDNAKVKEYARKFFEAGILLASQSPAHRALPSCSHDGKTPIALRADSFYHQVHSPEFTTRYPSQLLDDFFSYWSEPNKSKTKMRFELQKTWDTSRRLATWARNDFNHYGTSQPTIEQQRIDKLADILSK